jgi:hypothetical protein
MSVSQVVVDRWARLAPDASLLRMHREDALQRAQALHPVLGGHMTQGLELVGDEAVTEARIIAVRIDSIVDQVGVGKVPIADRFSPPLEVVLPRESEHPTGHGDGDSLVS